jgi:NNMT/PNMT/TEMT family
VPRRDRNAQAPWERFDSDAYAAHNYAEPRPEDLSILEKIAAVYSQLPGGLHFLEVGVGSNLYPILAALPFAERLDAIDYSQNNVDWVGDQLVHLSPSWLVFWKRLTDLSSNYAGVGSLDQTLRRVVRPERGSIFALPRAAWDVASMHFVAESITADVKEFRRACSSFVQSVRPGGPFVASFMEKSTGYTVSDEWFPAVAVDGEDVVTALSSAREVHIQRLPITGAALRSGYTGMLFASGRR